MFNQTIVLGNLFQDPVIRYTAQNTAIVNIRIGTNTYYKSEGVSKQKTESHDVFFTGSVAENVNKYLKKGSLVFILGEQSTSIQDDPIKGKIYHRKVKGHVIKFLDGKNKDNAYTDTNTQQYDEQHSNRQSQSPAQNEYQRNNATGQRPAAQGASTQTNQYQQPQEGFAPNSGF